MAVDRHCLVCWRPFNSHTPSDVFCSAECEHEHKSELMPTKQMEGSEALTTVANSKRQVSYKSVFRVKGWETTQHHVEVTAAQDGGTHEASLIIPLRDIETLLYHMVDKMLKRDG